MTALIQQLPALVGVAVGALASYFVAAAGERARWRRSMITRWDEKRLDAYAQYSFAVKRVFYVVIRIGAHHGYSSYDQALAPDEGLQLLAAANIDRTVKWESLLLLGSPESVTAARQWHESVGRLEKFLHGGREYEQSEWRQAVEETNQMRARFYDCARVDLRIPRPQLPDNDPLPSLFS
jgi:hypothetical protein